MKENFTLYIDINCQTFKADCVLWFGRYINITVIEPINGINLIIPVSAAPDNLSDKDQAKEIATVEIQKLHRQIGYIKEFRKEYETIYDAFVMLEAVEYDIYNKQDFASSEDRSKYLEQMHQRTSNFYMLYLNKIFPGQSITAQSDMAIQPYILAQLLKKES